MRKFILILTLISLPVMSFVPMGYAMDSVTSDNKQTQQRSTPHKNDDTAKKSYFIFSETMEKEDTEEKILFDILNRSHTNATRAGHLLHNLYSVPPERHYLPYEPPIA